jgi:hypothetical protein
MSRQTVGHQLTHASGLSAPHLHAAASLQDADSSTDPRADDAGVSD